MSGNLFACYYISRISENIRITSKEKFILTAKYEKINWHYYFKLTRTIKYKWYIFEKGVNLIAKCNMFVFYDGKY